MRFLPPLLCSLVLAGTAHAESTLRFERQGAIVKELDLPRLRQLSAPVPITTDDPYYGKRKRFVALPLAPLLVGAFAQSVDQLRGQQFLLKAKDGYGVPISGERLLEGGAALAIADRTGKWEPIGPGRADPAPFYLIWAGAEQRDLKTHPRPWQLVTIEIVSWQEAYRHTLPPLEDAAAVRGAALFKERCIRCHAINQEGGRVGPDLNIPQAILEYRPLGQVRAYIQNPQIFRYSVMPSNPDLSPQALDDLVAYFSAMQHRKHDPSGDPKTK